MSLPVPNITDAKNLMGVLGFATNIIYLGKAYMAATQKQITDLDRSAKYGMVRRKLSKGKKGGWRGWGFS